MSTAPPDILAYLQSRRSTEMLRFLTCGSVDDGKSTLIGQLLHQAKGIYEDQLAAVKKASAKVGTTGGDIDLALLTDGLKAEQEQGITIDVAYRYFSTDKRKFIIADTPGHEQYTRNMATGASNCQLAIILIDARQGMLTQTRRHSFIVSLLGIKHVVVAINKMDLVGYAQATFEKIKEDYTGFVAKLGIPDVQFIPMSALKGDNVVAKSAAMPWYEGPPLLAHLETVHIASDRNLADLRFPVQYVLRPNLDFRGLAGTVASGIIRKGEEVMILPSGRRSRVASIVTYEGEVDEAFAPMAVAVTLTDQIDVSRGDMLVHPDDPPHVSSNMEAMVVWMAEQPFVAGRAYWIKQATRLVSGEIAAFRHGIDVNTLQRRPITQLAMNEIGQVSLSLNQPIAWDEYKANAATGAFILIDRLSNTTVGAGMIVPPPEREGGGDHWNQEPSARLGADAVSLVSVQERRQRLGHEPVTILLTGLTGSGKATVAFALEKKLFDAGCAVSVLHGTNMRMGLCRDLGFSADDRSENLRRSAEVARILNDAGLICIAAFVAPHEAVRQKARKAIGLGRFLQIYLSAPVEVCRQRDRTGAYAMADAGKILQFPGVSAAFEAPTDSDLVLATHELTVDQCAAQIMDLLRGRRIIA
jgi:bifunctional enzyme CysN/CysC